MEVMGGVMIMLLVLALLFCAVWFSLPILIVGLGRRLERVAAQLTQIETRISDLEHRLATQSALPAPADNKTISSATEHGGLDGTA